MPPKTDFPKFELSLKEKPGRHIMERTPRYDVLVNGEVKGELYYNMTGFTGYLPYWRGGKFDLGEKGISAFRKEVGILNREARETFAAAAADPERVLQTYDSEDPRIIVAAVGPRTGEGMAAPEGEVRTIGIYRKNWDAMVALWGTTVLSPKLFEELEAPAIKAGEPELADDSPSL